MDPLNALLALTNFVLIPGIAYGSQLALGALGVTLIYGILRFANIAHGDVMAFGTMWTILGTWLLKSWGVSLGFLPTALLVLPFGIVMTVLYLLAADKLVFSFYRKQRVRPVTLVMASLGVMFVTNGLVRLIIGPGSQYFEDGERFIINVREFMATTGLEEGVGLRTAQALTIAVALIVMVALFWFLNRTRTGKSMRAYSDNEDLALLSGINPDRVVMVTWILAGGLAAIAGVLFGLDKGFRPFTYFQMLLPIFAAAIVGGLGNPMGAIAGGYIIALSEMSITYAWRRVVAHLAPEGWEPNNLLQVLSSDYNLAVSFAIMVLVLIFRPTGIFRGKTI